MIVAMVAIVVTTLHWVLLASMFIPLLGLMGIIWMLGKTRSMRQERTPLAEKLLRSPGEGLRRELEKMDEQVNDIFIWTFFGPALVALFLVISNPGLNLVGSSLISAIFIGTTVTIGFALLVWRLISLIKKRRDYRLGFAGERAVAEELNQLMLDGCRVFHDVPMEPYGNIDHVLVAPAGVYAVETKTRRKRKTSGGKREYEVVFDGKMLQFPGATDSHSLPQARQQANRLRDFLSEAVGEPVKVGAILTFPGWFVRNLTKDNIEVFNPKVIRAAIVDRRSPVLSKQLIDRILHQLDRKCRDVEL